MSRSQGHHITRSQDYFITLQTSYCSWPWPLPWTFDLEMILTLTFKWPSQNSRSKVKGHLKVKCRGHKVIILQGHKVIVLIYIHLSVHGLHLYPGHLTLRWSWPWPLNNLHKNSMSKVKGHLKVKCRGHKVIILRGHKVIVLLYRYLTVQNRDWRLYSRF